MRADPGPALGAYFGEALPGEPDIQAFEARTGLGCSLVSYYWSWGLGCSETPIEFARAVLQAGRLPLLTWEPWRLPDAGRDPAVDPAFALTRVLGGDFDGYIDWFAGRLAALPGRILLRPMHEMNGNWYPWCGTTNGNRPEQFVAAWRRLRRLFARRGAWNARWIWCPYALSVPASCRNAIAEYYPGHDEVDLLGLDGYNWGSSRAWSRWQTFDELFGAAYRVLTLLGAKPVIITEIGCAETGGDKGEWLQEARARLDEDYSRIRAVVWFNVNKECDWRVDASPETLAAFRSSWASDRESRVAELLSSAR